MRIGNRLRALRLGRVMTQDMLAEKAGVSRATIIRLEAGEIAARISTIRKLAEALGVPPEGLVGGTTDTQVAA